MRGMPQAKKDEYKKKCQAIKVVVYDMDKLVIDLTKQLNKMPEHEGKEFQVKDSKLARIVGQDMISDTEACFYQNITEGFQMDVYRKSEEKIDEETGKKSTSFYVFPTCVITLSEEDLSEYVKEETTLDVFMADRFIYNQRIVGNIDFMISNFK